MSTAPLHAKVDGCDYIIAGVRFKPVTRDEYNVLLEAGVRVSSWYELPDTYNVADSWCFTAQCWDDAKYGTGEVLRYFFAAVEGA